MTKIASLLDFTKGRVKDFACGSILRKCDIISFCLLFLFFVDCSFSGGGKLLGIGSLSFRMAVAGGALVFALPKFLLNIKKYLKNPILWIFLAFVLFMRFSAVRGYNLGNNITVLVSDIKGFVWLFIVPVFIVAVDSKKRFEQMLNAVLIGAWLQAVFVIVVQFSCCFSTDAERFFYKMMLNEQLGILDGIAENVFRAFMRSCPYLVAACVILIFKQFRQDKLKWRYIVSIVVFLFSVLITFTRSLYGCVAIVVAIVILVVCLFYRSRIKIFFKAIVCVALVALSIVSVLEFMFDASYINFAISRTLGTPVKTSAVVVVKYKVKHMISQILDSNDGGDTEDYFFDDKIEELQDYVNVTGESDNVRYITKTELKELIAKNPIIGNGLGACSKTRNGPDEYFYYDMLARMGVIGLALYMAPFVYICVFVLRRRKFIKDNPLSIALLCAMVGFWMVTWFNPWMNAVLGIAVYALTATIPAIFCE